MLSWQQFSLLVVLVTAVAVVHGAKAPPDSDPADPTRPISAFVQMQVIEISKIDGVEQAFHADFYMLTSWYAPLAGTNSAPPGQPAVEYTGSEDLSSAALSDNFWSPQLEFINAREEITRLVEEPYSFALAGPSFTITDIPGFQNFVLPSGHVWILEDQRYQCDFTTPLSMQAFPFDGQFMQLLIESFWTSDTMRIVWAKPDAVNEIIREDIEIVGWSYQETIILPAALGKADNTLGVWYGYNGAWYDRLTIRALLVRQPDYYMTKIVAGVMLLVYMCAMVFALQVDEADRMMGTLQIFAGLVTFLFVASGDTPKVPYQTRLDLFMLWSFFNVAFIMIIHSCLYYWREDDVEELLAEREKEHAEAVEKLHSKHAEAAEIELGVASPSGQRVYVNEPPAGNGASKVHLPPTTWRLRHDEWADFTIRKWFAGLHLTRKVDAIAIPFLMIMYSIGTAVILGRSVAEPDLYYATWNDPHYQYNGAHYIGN